MPSSTVMDGESLKRFAIGEAHRLGFVAAGVTGLEPFDTLRHRALESIAAGRMDGMPWFNQARVEGAADLGRRLAWARSVIALAWQYRPAVRPRSTVEQSPGTGRVAAYACLDRDYHQLLAERCDALVTAMRRHDPELRAKRFVDHGWAFDRAIAERAGIGFGGKHTQLISQEAGSYVLLASVVISATLSPDRPSRRSCGRCAACLPACPTGALIAPGVIDAPRCISYLTIEHRGPIPVELRPLMGTWIFGCDLCQEACPINERLAPPAVDGANRGPAPFIDLVQCLELDEAGFAERFRGTAISRAGRAGLARNCAVALGNSGDPASIPALRRAATHDDDSVVREAAAWAIDRIGRRDSPAAPTS